MICFHFFYFIFISTKFLKNQKATIRKAFCWRPASLTQASKSPWLKLPSGRENRPQFALSLSILAGSNRIIYYFFFFCNPCLIPKKIHPPFNFRENPSPIRFPGKSILVWFPRKFILVWFPRKSMQNPQGKPKKLFFFFFLLVFSDLF